MQRRELKRGGHNQLRIIAGKWRGRRIEFPAAAQLRPTPNRVRETLFNWLRDRIEGSACLDLFAGSGALGIEALSRGAESCLFVEQDRKLAENLRVQLEFLGDSSRVVQTSAFKFLDTADDELFDIVFADPPFQMQIEELLDRLRSKLRLNGMLYIEQAIETGLPVVNWGDWHRVGKAGSVCYGLLQPRR